MTRSHLLGFTLALAFTAWALSPGAHTRQKSVDAPPHASRFLHDPLPQ